MYNWIEALNLSQEEIIQQTGPRTPVIWMAAQDCTACAESFIRSFEPSSATAILDFISLEYSDLLSGAAGHQLEANLTNILEKNKGEYILVVEGSIPLQDEFLMIAGKSVRKEILKVATDAKAVIAVGSCSAWGGISAAEPNPTEAVALTEILPKETPIVLVPGCPPIAEVIIGTLTYIHFHNQLPELDRKGRPKVFYHTTVHMACHRKPYFDQKQFAESYDDEGYQKGYCLLKLGCKGPTAFNACETIGWNGESCSPISAGYACIGCSEKGFWDKGNLKRKK